MTRLSTPLGDFDTWPTGTITRALQAGQWWDAHLRPALDAAPCGVALDLGAHIGWFSRYLAGAHDRVIVVEPHPETFRLLERNCDLHAPQIADRIQRWPVAAYAVATTLLQVTELHAEGDMGAVSFADTDGWEALRVVGLPLDAYLPVDCPVTLIKADCQGADLAALQGLTRTIARCRPRIIFEWEAALAQHQGHTWEDYLRFFAERDYTVARITTDFWDYVAVPR